MINTIQTATFRIINNIICCNTTKQTTTSKWTSGYLSWSSWSL